MWRGALWAPVPGDYWRQTERENKGNEDKLGQAGRGEGLLGYISTVNCTRGARTLRIPPFAVSLLDNLFRVDSVDR